MENNNKKKWSNYIIAFLFITSAVLFDQFTKCMAVKYLKGKSSITLIPSVFELQYLENRGAAFGIMQNRQLFFIVITCIVMAAVLYFYSKIPNMRKYIPMRICMILLCSGAIGNFIDRTVNNYVVDFLYFSLIDFPIFNVADCYVVIACFLFAFLILFYYKDNDLKFFSLNKNKEA